ncbi:MAG: hypothetical protein J6A79_09070 [Clostridia bacterium]|nr:hypothetical protein [Clostridia bacterium]
MALDNNIMDWGDAIENDGQEFVVLPEGDYTFTVTNFERGRFPGSAKIPPCNKATLTINIDNDKGSATARFDLILYRTLEWKIASFFRCIGQKKHGERVVMDWNKVVGARGRAHIKPRSYTKDGEERQVNDVDRFLDYDPSVDFTPVKDDGDLPWGNGGF